MATRQRWTATYMSENRLYARSFFAPTAKAARRLARSARMRRTVPQGAVLVKVLES